MYSLTPTPDDDSDPRLAGVPTSTIVAELHRRTVMTDELEGRAAALGIELRRKPVWRRALSRLLGSPKSS